jgi:hypothetical protein
VRLEGLRKLTKFNYLILSRTRDLPVCNIVPQPIRYAAYTLNYKQTTLRGYKFDDKVHLGVRGQKVEYHLVGPRACIEAVNKRQLDCPQPGIEILFDELRKPYSRHYIDRAISVCQNK